MKPWQWLAWLIFGAVLMVGAFSLVTISEVTQRNEALLREHRESQALADAQRDKIVRLSAHSEELSLASAKKAVQLQLCTLRPKLESHCKKVARQAKRLTKAIDRFQDRVKIIHDGGVAIPDGSTSGDGGTVTHTVTIPPPHPHPHTTPPPHTTATPPPDHVGESDQCPPSNPHCP